MVPPRLGLRRPKYSMNHTLDEPGARPTSVSNPPSSPLRRGWALPLAMLALGCTPEPSPVDEGGSSDTGRPPGPDAGTGPDTTGAVDSTRGGEDSTGRGTTSESDGGIKLDVAGTPDLPPLPPPVCTVEDGLDGVGACSNQGPPDSFEPQVQWSWAGQDGQTQSATIPLVANLTDDDGNGTIDLCDIPDIVVSAYEYGTSFGGYDGNLYALDGATGRVHWKSDVVISARKTAALGDIDGDGLPEIVAVEYGSSALVAFEHDGQLKWVGDGPESSDFDAIALADLDGDGDVEIVLRNEIYDHLGQRQVTLNDQAGVYFFGSAPAVADLDGDGDQEVVLGRSAFHHDGTVVFSRLDLQPSYPQIANLDDDPFPEVLLQSSQGITVLEHDGTSKYEELRPTGAVATLTNWLRPSTVHDFDGDGISEFAASSSMTYSVYEQDASIIWSAPVEDFSGIATGTAFDFLGDGIAEAMYADEQDLYIFDGEGSVLLQVPRSSDTIIEYPVVADVDNDGSAEIVVVSNTNPLGVQTSPLVQVIRDVDDRWIQARRIWNQHTYHVTNVREDGTIPAHESPSWEELNTYRTNAQIENGGVCLPPPPG